MDRHFEDTRNRYSNLGELAGLPTKFFYEDLVTATNDFSISNKLGSGGSGSVFKGILKDGTSIAVTRVDDSTHGTRQIVVEVLAIASIKHTHLVCLRGYCTHITTELERTFHIVYDHLQNGSLEEWIFKRKGTSQCLPWKSRYKVAVEVAKALMYLHHDCGEPRLHLVIKPSSILLDKDFRAVLSDFGMSRLMKSNQSRAFTTSRGTYGYIAPKWH